MKILCALNPTAGSGAAPERWPRIQALFQSLDIAYDLLADPDIRLGRQVADHLEARGLSAYEAVVGIGGDGTHSAVINALLDYRARHSNLLLPPYALIPLGTGNDIAKSFGIDSRDDFFADDLRRAVTAIVHGAEYLLDAGFTGKAWFVDALTIGLDSHVLREHNRRKRRMGRFPWLRRLIKGNVLYVLSMGTRFWKQDLVHADIRVDGRPWYSGPVLNVIINNTRVYGGEFVFFPDAYANDGLLDVILFTGHTDYLKKYLLSFRQQPSQIRRMADHLGKVSLITQGKSIEVALSRPERAQMDGEELPAAGHFAVTVIPHAIRLKIPAEPA